MDFHEEDDDIIRSSLSQMFFKIGILKNFATFTGKHLCWSLKACNFIKNRLLHRDFPVNIMKFLRTPFLQNVSSGCFSIILLLFLNPGNCLIWLDFFFWKKYYFDFFTEVFFYLHNFYSYFLAIARL